MTNTNWKDIKMEEQVKLQNEIATFRNTRESFVINDVNWLWKMNIMIVKIFSMTERDDMVKVIDMSEMELMLDVDSYDIWLTELLIARKNVLDEEKKAFEKFNSVITNKND